MAKVANNDMDMLGTSVETSEDDSPLRTAQQAPKRRGRPPSSETAKSLRKTKGQEGDPPHASHARNKRARKKAVAGTEVECTENERAEPEQQEDGRGHTSAKKANAKTTAKGRAKAKASVKAKARAKAEVQLDDLANLSDQVTSEDEDESAEPCPPGPSGHRATGARVSDTCQMKSDVSSFAQWAVDKLLPDERQQVCRRERTLLSFCTGMATEVMVMDALARAFATHDLRLSHRHIACCEKEPAKRQFIQTHMPVFLHYFKDVGDMSRDVIYDERSGQPVERPDNVDVLTVGFSCKDISGLTSKPKSERGKEGSSATTLKGTLAYLDALPLESRPKMLLLENAQPPSCNVGIHVLRVVGDDVEMFGRVAFCLASPTALSKSL